MRANFYFKKRKQKRRQEMNGRTFSQNPCKRGKSQPPPPPPPPPSPQLGTVGNSNIVERERCRRGGGEFHSPPLTSRSFLQSIEASTIRHAVFSTHRIRVSVSLIRSISLPRQDLSLFSSKTNLEDSIENQGKELLRSCVIIRKQCYVPGQVQRRFRHV